MNAASNNQIAANQTGRSVDAGKIILNVTTEPVGNTPGSVTRQTVTIPGVAYGRGQNQAAEYLARISGRKPPHVSTMFNAIYGPNYAASNNKTFVNIGQIGTPHVASNANGKFANSGLTIGQKGWLVQQSFAQKPGSNLTTSPGTVKYIANNAVAGIDTRANVTWSNDINEKPDGFLQAAAKSEKKNEARAARKPATVKSLWQTIFG